MDVVLSPCHEYASAYIDDIIVFSSSWEEHLDHLRDVFRRLQVAGLKAKAIKCNLAMEEGNYLGHRVGRGRIQLNLAKVEGIAIRQRRMSELFWASIDGSFRDLLP